MENIPNNGVATINSFINPANNRSLIVLLPDFLYPKLYKKGVRIFGNFFGSDSHIKFVAAYEMITHALNEGPLGDAREIYVASSGNTAHAAIVIARILKLGEVVPVIPRDCAPDKKEMLSLLGANWIQREGDGIAFARTMGQKPFSFCLDQYVPSSHNAVGHEKYTAPFILEKLKYEIQVFAATLGTGGTMVGCDNRFRKEPTLKGRKPITLGVRCAPGPENAVPGVRTLKGLAEVSLPWRRACNKIVEVTRLHAYNMSRELMLLGFPAGPSSGQAFCGLLDFLTAEDRRGRLGKYKNPEGILNAVFIAPDGPRPYIQKYSTILTAEQMGSSAKLI